MSTFSIRNLFLIPAISLAMAGAAMAGPATLKLTAPTKPKAVCHKGMTCTGSPWKMAAECAGNGGDPKILWNGASSVGVECY
jgi:predicted lipoprotein with Yx(FWY)xxD motif